MDAFPAFLWRGLRLLLGTLVLMVPLLLAQRTLTGTPGEYRNEDSYGHRGMSPTDYAALHSRDYKVKTLRQKLAAKQSEIASLRTQVQERDLQKLGQSPAVSAPSGFASPGANVLRPRADGTPY